MYTFLNFVTIKHTENNHKINIYILIANHRQKLMGTAGLDKIQNNCIP